MLSTTKRHAISCAALTVIAASTSLSLAGSSEAEARKNAGGGKSSNNTLQASSMANETPLQRSGSGGKGPLKLSEFAGVETGLFSWLGEEGSFNRTVKCKGTTIGSLNFLFRPFTWTDLRSDGSYLFDYGGMAVEGGFTYNNVNPCGPTAATPTFHFMQMVLTNDPLTGKPTNSYYMDVKKGVNPKVTPWYPNDSDDNNPAPNGDVPFTTSYYDAAKRAELSEAVYWDAMNMLVCQYEGKIDVISSFQYGYTVEKPGLKPDGSLETDHDGIVRVSARAPHNYAEPPGPGIIKILNEHLNSHGNVGGSKSRKGFKVSAGCCCPKPVAIDATSAPDGMTTIVIHVPEGESLQAVCVFPRNQWIDNDTLCDDTYFNDWVAEDASMYGVPMQSWQEEPSEMYQNGAYLYPESTIFGPETFSLTIPLSGHESFLDLYFLDSEWQWNPWVQETDHLLGDLDGDGAVTSEDVILLELAINDPSAYDALYPGIDSTFAGDFLHDGSIDTDDLAKLIEQVNDVYEETDSVARYVCDADVTLDGLVDIADLLAVIGSWGACDGCRADIDGNDIVDIQDLLEVIGSWGGCSHE